MTSVRIKTKTLSFHVHVEKCTCPKAQSANSTTTKKNETDPEGSKEHRISKHRTYIVVFHMCMSSVLKPDRDACACEMMHFIRLLSWNLFGLFINVALSWERRDGLLQGFCESYFYGM